jgi:hypothetical protein
VIRAVIDPFNMSLTPVARDPSHVPVHRVKTLFRGNID